MQQSFGLIVFAAVLTLSACQKTGGPPDPTGTAHDDSLTQCREVPIEELYQNPHAYLDDQICTAGVLNVEYHGSGVYPDAMIGQPLLERFLLIDIPFADLVVRGFRSRDLVTVRGRFNINADCIDLARDKTDETTWTCLPIEEPLYLEDTAVERIERPDPFDICRHIDLEDYSPPPDDLTWQMICVDGYLHRVDGHWRFSQTTIPEDTAPGISLGTLYFDGNRNCLQDGAQVYIAANALGQSAELFDIQCASTDEARPRRSSM